jgi:hypothetical protein
MKKMMVASVALSLLLGACVWAADEPKTEEGFVSLFNGKNFDGWKVGNNPKTFRVQDGMIVVNGRGPSHLFYEGDVGNHNFKNFVFKADVMTFPRANSGIYFHTKFQQADFPDYGIECQVDNSHSDPIRTGSLYGIKNIMSRIPGGQPGSKIPTKDNTWYTQEISCIDGQVVVKLDGTTVLEYTVPDASKEHGFPKSKQIWQPSGTFALQGHDPGSKVYFKNLRVKILPD